MSKLKEIIAQRILSKGIIGFAEFMELALYCPEHGFYEKKKDIIGKQGDFYTSVSVGNLLGQLLAFKFENWLRGMKAWPESKLTLVELGAHDGQLASDILHWFRINSPSRLETMDYLIVEPSTTREKWQQEKLREFEGIARWSARLPAEIHGIIFSNELLDALPVRRLEWSANARRWFEWGVIGRNGGFAWQKMASPSNEQLLGKVFPPALEEVLPDKFAWEVSEAAMALWSEAARSLRDGYLVTLDYGFREQDLLERARPGGTLRAYHDHSVSQDVLDKPGDQDLTYSVNFDSVCRAGEQEGLSTRELDSQSRFLTTIIKESFEGDGWKPDAGELRKFQTLSHPDFMGSAFHVLVQSRLRIR